MVPISVRWYLALLCVGYACGAKNNVCETFEDYNSIETSENCWYNPDVSADAPEMIQRHGYPMEEFEIVTEDGYVLTMFRIPPKGTAKKGVVLLEHPLSAYSGVWLDKGNHSLGFILADAGYDVWLANARGTQHSLKHMRYHSSQKEYWNFTFHEIGLYDLQAQFEFVHNATGSDDITLVGHSMGSSSALVYATLRPEDARRFVKVFILMSPPAYLAHVRSPSRHFTELIESTLEILDDFGVYSIQHDNVTQELIANLCLRRPPRQRLCMNIMQSVMGWNPSDVYPPWVPVTFTQNPGGVSVKSFYHYLQQVDSGGRFQYYDYGTKMNKVYYHAAVPPEYPVKNVTVPIYMIYGLKDTVTTTKDTLKLYRELPPAAKIYGIRAVDYNHVDFMYGRTVKRKVYDHIVTFLDTIVYGDTKNDVTK